MKTLYVTPQLYPQNFQKCKNLGQLIALFEKQGENDELYIIKINVNGSVIDRDEEALLQSLSVNEIKEMTFHYSTLNEMINQLFVDLIRMIQNTQIKAISFSQDFRKNQKVDEEKVKFSLIQCRSVIESLEELFSMHINEIFKLRHPSLWQQAEREMTNILQCIFQGMKWSEVDFISDLLEYDLTDALDVWEELLEKELQDNPQLMGIFQLKTHAQKSDNGVDV